MTRTKAVLRRWGSSLATVIPPDVARKEGLREGDEIVVDVQRARRLEEFFGILSEKRMDAQKMKDSLRREDNE